MNSLGQALDDNAADGASSSENDNSDESSSFEHQASVEGYNDRFDLMVNGSDILYLEIYKDHDDELEPEDGDRDAIERKDEKDDNDESREDFR